ncbi:MAG TPA: NRDE family protein, partial [Pyrinomonadaceae bacterium]|nr:NRDE family protein [Pyrinomonadaceae bacterium]
LLSQDEISTEAIFSILADRSRADDSYLPDTGVGIDLERTLSPLFVSSPFYGTRSSTVVLINQEDVTFIERSFFTGPDDFEEVKYQFKTEPE